MGLFGCFCGDDAEYDEDDEVVHHINRDKSNNYLYNLEIMKKKDHDKHHGRFWFKK